MKPVIRFISDHKTVPARLRGCKVTITLTDRKLQFGFDTPDDLTPNEQAFLSVFAGECVDSLNERVPGAIGELTAPPGTGRTA